MTSIEMNTSATITDVDKLHIYINTTNKNFELKMQCLFFSNANRKSGANLCPYYHNSEQSKLVRRQFSLLLRDKVLGSN